MRVYAFAGLLFAGLVSAQATTTTAAATSSVSLVPFATLPACAQQCGPLYDAQGSCTPPGSAVSDLATYTSCFCAYSTLQPFYTSDSGVCAANVCDDADLTTIQNWFLSFCGSSSTTTATASSSTSTSSSSSSSSSSHTTWLDTHWKWVVMIIVLAVGITAIWIAAFYFRRRYLRKKDGQIERGTSAQWGPSQAHPQPYGDGVVDARAEKSRAGPVSALRVAQSSTTLSGSERASPAPKSKRISKHNA